MVRDLRGLGHPVTVQAVYHWIAGRRLPHPTRAVALVQLSQGSISLEDVYGRSDSRLPEDGPRPTREPQESAVPAAAERNVG